MGHLLKPWLIIDAIKKMTRYKESKIAGWLRISERTMRTYQSENKVLEKGLSEQVVMLRTVMEKGKAVFGESDGFEPIRNKRQLASYAGFDIKEKKSGTSVKGKLRISKRGNRHLRKAMHFPTLGVIRRNERFKAIFARLVAKHGIKMKAVVAMQRRLLEMIYMLYKTDTTYDESYLQHNPLAESERIENE